MSRTTLVTGAAGFAGGHLLDRLASAGDPLVGWYKPGGSPPAGESSVEWQAVDILDRRAVSAAIERIKPGVVYHCAGAAHVGLAWERTEATFAVNVRGTPHLLDALAAAGGAARVLVTGSALVYRPADEPLTEEHPLGPAGPYALSKLAQEMLGQHADGSVQVITPRAFNHFGPRQSAGFSTAGFARQIAAIEAGQQLPEIAVGNLDARRDLTDVRDTVRAYQLIAERGEAGRAYNVCSGRAVAIGDVLQMLVSRARVAIRVRADPARFRPADVPLLVGDPRRLRDELGWEPAIPLEKTLDDLLAYWRAAFA
jgi:GDP-4-dehydro-6-deoxy-D-mannose reductase